jgi:hypothetical protein
MNTGAKLLLVAVAALVLVTASAGLALAVTNGLPDGNAHPYVGLVVFYDAQNTPLWRCSGTVLAPTVFLTAGHCTEGAARAQIWLDPIIPSGDPKTKTGYPWTGGNAMGTPHTEPGFCLACAPGLPGFDTHDVGVITLDTPVTLSEYGLLPIRGQVDALPMNTKLTVVGFGVQQKVGTGVPPYNRWVGRSRMYAPSLLIQSKNVQSGEYLKLTANPAQGKGGTCFGDSGGPVFLGNTRTVLGVNSYVTNSNCAGVTYSNRIDLQYALNFVRSFLP